LRIPDKKRKGKQLDQVHNIIIFILKSLYTTLPAIIANMAPLIVKNVGFLDFPVDFNKTFRGKPVLGPNKTFRGLLAGVVFSIAVLNLQYLLYVLTGFDFTLYDFKAINFELLGFLMGFGVITGDMVKSFFKRQCNIGPGERFIPWDQIDCVLGGLVFGRIAWAFPLTYALLIIIMTFIMHITIRFTAFYLGLNDSKW
jgi:CDP-2,3-bis-(O-geranylgeranyl)-sn-glycerol synthase